MDPEIMGNSTILAVDDNRTNLQVLLEYLKASGFRVLVSNSGESALLQAEAAIPDLILLDIMMSPGIDGFETCQRLKKNEKTKHIPVVFLTAFSESADKAKGIEAGGADFITKPFDGMELLARVKTHLKLNFFRRALEQKSAELQKANKALMNSRKQIEKETRTDPLTNLPNRREIMDIIHYEQARSERSRKPFTIAIADIDNFKKFNEKFGYECGDHVLVSISGIMRNAIRKQDHLARWGGEEFMFIFPETDLEGGKIVCEKIRNTVENNIFEYKGSKFSISITLALSLVDYKIAVEDCIKNIDNALYIEKQQGKSG